MKKRNANALPNAIKVMPLQHRSHDIPSDVLGSYTGSSMDGSRPVQDADDL